MGWDLAQALQRMPTFAKFGIRSFEQPLTATDLQGAARLVREIGLDVVADESLNTRESLQRLIDGRACTAINARISKCGGLISTLARCREAQNADLWVQMGSQVGESPLLSAAQLHLCTAFIDIRHAEGCFGSLLLKEIPAAPRLQMRLGGRPPQMAGTSGLGIEIDRTVLLRHRVGHWQGGDKRA
jgi:L-alanine-DL-glutamate epimerase-like enolase superfamily enzyme